MKKNVQANKEVVATQINDEIFEKIVVIKGKKRGPTSIIIGGVHGNEKCGVNAILELLPNLKIDAGKLIIAFGNPRAIVQNVRSTDANLNRVFKPYKSMSKEEKSSYEYARATFLKKHLKKADFLLDVHASFSAKSRRFIICEDNASHITQFLPFNLIVTGFDAIQPGGTDYYMNSIGKIGICVECGCLGDPESDRIAKQAILNFLKATKNIHGKVKVRKQKKIRVYNMYMSKSEKFSLAKKFDDFEKVKKDQILGIDGVEEVRCGENAIIIFAQDTTKINDEVYLLAK